jgi:hypothetical protein
MNDQSDNGLPSRKKRAAFGLFGILLYKRYIPPGDVKPFKLRWVILGMFVLVFFLNKFFG